MIKQTASRWILTGTAALVMVAGATLGATAASAASVPGDLLYNVKRAAERVELASALTTQARAALQQQLVQRRREEIRELVLQGSEAEVEFSGTLKSVSGQVWMVDDVRVTLDPAASVVGDPVIGQQVTVYARTLPGGQVRATRVEVKSVGDDSSSKDPAGRVFESPLPSPSPVASKTPEPSETPEAEQTPEPAHDQSPEANNTPEPRETPEVSKTPEAHDTLEVEHTADPTHPAQTPEPSRKPEVHTPEATHSPEVHAPEPTHSPEIHTPEPEHKPEATSAPDKSGSDQDGGNGSGDGGGKD
jgi:Domain of unknown function (DUF5667)